MVDYLTNGGNENVAMTVANWLTDNVGKVQPKGHRYNLLAKPIAQ